MFVIVISPDSVFVIVEPVLCVIPVLDVISMPFVALIDAFLFIVNLFESALTLSDFIVILPVLLILFMLTKHLLYLCVKLLLVIGSYIYYF